MFLNIKIILAYVGAVGIVLGALFILASMGAMLMQDPSSASVSATASTALLEEDVQPHMAEVTGVSSYTTDDPSSAENPFIPLVSVSSVIEAEAPVTPPPSSSRESVSTDDRITRIQNPYPFPPHSIEAINEDARAALVNILCSANTESVRPITASGVFIDSRGVILTNAHVAQYVLLSQDEQLSLNCIVRHGAPASAEWSVEILYIPPVWVEENAKDVATRRPTGTGEHDYALLRITGTLDGSSPPASFPVLPPDVREGIGFLDDPVLIASYPAEFLQGSTQLNLYPVSSVTTIQELLTFGRGAVDLISVGGVAGAQAGSSGGAVVNPWGRLVGLITTTSEGATTAERDLRALTISYIERDIKAQTGLGFAEYLSGDLAARAAEFNAHEAPRLVQLLIDQLSQ